VAVHDVDQLLTSIPPASLVLLSIDNLREGGWTLIPRITSQAPSAHVVLLSTDESQDLVARALAKGAEGFIHKRADPAAFLDALRRVAGGETVVLGAYDDGSGESVELSAGSPSLLTDREVEVIRLLAQDQSAKEVASTLGVSIRTVHVHLQNAYKKLGVHGRIGAILEAGKEGVLEDHGPW
jgi:DNA-binding NarL/FixJ family response regulator